MVNEMGMEKQHCCCFFGHRKVHEATELTDRLTKTVEALITDKNVNTFFFGSKSEFDKLCLKVVTELKVKYPYIRRVYVRAEFADINDSYKDYLSENYEDTYYPERIRGAGKAVYVERNREMIDNSNFCVVYYDENYAPPRRKNSKRALTDYQPKSGTKIAYDYAVKKGIEIINILKNSK